MGRIRLYADNACDLDKELLEKLNVTLFYISVTIKDRTYLDRYDLQPSQFYHMLEMDQSIVPTTAQITPAQYLKEFKQILENTDDDIIYIAFSSGLSGTYQSACMARDIVGSDRITVIDSKSASVGYGLTVLRAAQAIQKGMSKEQVIAEIEDNIRRMEHLFIVGSFDMLKRGGRVTAASARLGNLLNIKLILHFKDGRIYPLEKVHGLKKAKRRLLEIMDERGYDLSRQIIGINHSNDYEGALELKKLVQDTFGCHNFLISEIGGVIGSHVGAGTYSVFFLHQ